MQPVCGNEGEVLEDFTPINPSPHSSTRNISTTPNNQGRGRRYQHHHVKASRKATRALEAFVDEAALVGMSEESSNKSSSEEVDEKELDEELARLWEDMVENPMSPTK
ncbi:hypothetical protein BU15DRAFT_64762 [Melanogaster broomeanus]|nr:hypothetical protein BU15DRAFT_64762 [Melanogaster broomeanus]